MALQPDELAPSRPRPGSGDYEDCSPSSVLRGHLIRKLLVVAAPVQLLGLFEQRETGVDELGRCQ
ncbi:hypothetical protein [Amycolatopsis sp. lyj-90]|uniref:hypothetical protein n=1 Tax=Amycolatopsis sp. lyj-90 TaxID=2789285 RepID=UPI00397B3A8F